MYLEPGPMNAKAHSASLGRQRPSPAAVSVESTRNTASEPWGVTPMKIRSGELWFGSMSSFSSPLMCRVRPLAVKVMSTTYLYAVVVDITFTANGRTRHIKGLEKLDMLPNQSSPLLIFMGVTPQGSDAVFLVDSTLTAAGEGRCRPSEAECAFAFIGPGSRYMFTNEAGDSYEIKIDEIRKVQISAGGASAKAGKATGSRARAAVGPARRFVPPILADLVVVASQSLEGSNT